MSFSPIIPLAIRRDVFFFYTKERVLTQRIDSSLTFPGLYSVNNLITNWATSIFVFDFNHLISLRTQLWRNTFSLFVKVSVAEADRFFSYYWALTSGFLPQLCNEFLLNMCFEIWWKIERASLKNPHLKKPISNTRSLGILEMYKALKNTDIGYDFSNKKIESWEDWHV